MMNLLKKVAKIPFFKLFIIILMIIAFWQIVNIRNELGSVKKDLRFVKLLNSEEYDDSGLELRIDDLELTVGYLESDSISTLESSVLNLESQISGIGGLESRVDDLESRGDDLESKIRRLKHTIDY